MKRKHQLLKARKQIVESSIKFDRAGQWEELHHVPWVSMIWLLEYM